MKGGKREGAGRKPCTDKKHQTTIKTYNYENNNIRKRINNYFVKQKRK